MSVNMKSVFCVVFFFATFITLSSAAVGYGYFNDPANPGKCTIKNLILSPGEEAKDPEGECTRIVCRNEGLAQMQSTHKIIFLLTNTNFRYKIRCYLFKNRQFILRSLTINMKSISCVVIFFTAFITLSYAAVSFDNYLNPANPGKCTLSNGIILSPGEEAKDPNQDCARIVCGDEGMVQIQSCGAVEYPVGCSAGDYLDISLQYPDCCEREASCLQL
ncbi:uncharacterized protein LOC129949257 [Eupeodes corollae]|uniref:uncharacterized protein LOC129949257 n=1 Tax=Eupeodes corollae TaxID=290404 RepID=UPI0024905EF6|nr:uncharacterized protein LOC129949257 [Eupeodes corollae]